MTPNLRILALASGVALVIGAATAQGAAAAAFNSNSPTGNTTLSGNQTTTHEMTFESGVLKCTTASFTGTQAGNAAASIRLHPVYGGCKTTGIKATVDTAGCDYVFTKTGGNTTSGITTKVDIVCESGKDISVTHEICTKTVRPQSGLGTVTFTNSSPETDLTATFAITGIAYEEIGAGCAKPGAHANGTYKGVMTLEGFQDPGEGMVKIWVE